MKNKKTLLKILFSLLILLILILIVGYFYGKNAYEGTKKRVNDLTIAGQSLKRAFNENDLELMKKELNNVENKYRLLEKEVKKHYWLKNIPWLGSYVKDLDYGLNAGEEILKAADLSLKTISPYADLLGFKKGESSFVEKSADERIQTAVLTLDKMLQDIDKIAFHIDKARENIDKINETRYPEKIGKRMIRSQIKELKDQFDSVATLFVDAKPFLKKLPEILGKDEEKTYLFLFQNDKELRPTGGFLTAFAIFKVKNGKFTVSRSSDIYELDASISSHPKAPSPILTYHKNVYQFNIRDSNLSPDFVESIKLFNSLYEKSSQKVKYDGIFAIDTHVLVDVLEILGDTQVNGVNFSARIDKRCDCPQAIYTLFDIIDRPVPYIKENRKGILGDLLYVLMQKALGFSPSQYWGKLAQSLIKNLQEKHILIYLVDKEAQESIEKINFAGRIRPYQGDYLHINDTNFAGQKSNMFVSHQVTSETKIENGKVKRKLVIVYKNPYPHSDCNLERGGLCLNATLRNWLRIYVPEGSKLVSFNGSETKVNTYNELAKTVFEGFLRVNPQGKSQVVVEYELPFRVDNEKEYKLLIQKQPGTKGHEYSVLINNREKGKFKLVSDTEIRNK